MVTEKLCTCRPRPWKPAAILAAVLAAALAASHAPAALFLDVGSGGAIAVTGPTPVIPLDLVARVSDGNGNPADDGISKFYATFLSTTGGLLKGDMAVTFTPTNPLNNNPFPGTPTDLDGDGDLDVGSLNSASAADWVLLKAPIGQVTAPVVHYGTLTFTGIGWGSDPHGVTEIWGIGRNSPTTNLWREDGVNLIGVASTGVKTVLYLPTTAPVPVTGAGGAEIRLGPGQNVLLDATGGVGSMNTWSWDFNNDAVEDATGPTPLVTYEMLAALGLPNGAHTGTLRTSWVNSPPVNEFASPFNFTLVPEPGTLALLGLASAAALARRREKGVRTLFRAR